MTRLPVLFLAAATAVTSCPAAQTAVPPHDLATNAQHTSRAHEWACSLADEVGPRLAGSEGDARAVAWGMAKMKELGLANVRAEKAMVTHWERGEGSAEIVSPSRHRLAMAALGGSIATPAAGIEADVVRVESIEALQALPGDQVKGRIVFFDKVMERRADGQGYEKTVGVRSLGANEAAKKGALASLIRSVGTSDARFPHTGAMRYEQGVEKIPAAALAIPDAEHLRRLIAKGPVRIRLMLASRTLPDAESANVIGEIVGRSTPEEIVLLGAHLDSWDLGTGAIDDAAGVGVVLEVARLLREKPPRRTVRVVLFANEENGLRGAKAYAQAHQAELARHVAAMEVDSGSGKPMRVVYRAGPAAPAAMAKLAPALALRGLPAPAADEEAGGADLIPLEPAGVPQLSIHQDSSRYFDDHHTANDTCDKIDPADLAQVTAVAVLVTQALAEMDGDLGRAAVEPAK